MPKSFALLRNFLPRKNTKAIVYVFALFALFAAIIFGCCVSRDP